MIKLVVALRRRPDLSLEEFQTYWRETHAPLVAELAEALNIQRYVQMHTMDLPGLHRALQRRNGGSPEPYDGVAETWYDSLDSLGGDDPAMLDAQKALAADEPNFIDLANSPMWLSEEFEVIPLS